MAPSFTILDEGAPREVPARVDGDRVRLAPEAVRSALGWELKPEGLCRGDVCVPVRDRARLADPDGIDLAALADALGRPLALDAAAGAAALGTAAAERAAALASLDAPEFSLPDLDGKVHALSEQRGKKVLLVCWASW